MNIIFLLSSTYPNYTGGIENWLYNVSERLVRDNEVYVISKVPNATEIRQSGIVGNVSNKLRLIRIRVPITNEFIYKIFYHSYMVPMETIIEEVIFYRTLKGIVEERGNEYFFIISLDAIHTANVAMKVKKKFSNVAFINSVRCPHAELESKNWPLLRKWFYMRENLTLKNADRIWANGYDTAEMLVKRGFSSKVIKNGVDCKRASIDMEMPITLKPTRCDINLLTIGTVYDIKGYKELITAIAICKKKYGILCGMTSFGKGNPEKYIEQAKALGIENQIIFAGVQNKTIEYGKQFDVIACLSGGSGLSMACLESLATGRPVIAWDSPVYTQIINNKVNGLLVEYKKPEAIADAIYWVFSNKTEAEKIGSNGAIRANDFDWSNIVDVIKVELNELQTELKFGGGIKKDSSRDQINIVWPRLEKEAA